MQNDENEPDRLRRLQARRMLDRVRGQRDEVMRSHLSMTGWVVASLLAVNRGGAAATLTATDRVGFQPLAGCLFVTGLMFALLMATATQWFTSWWMGKTETTIASWLHLSETGKQHDPSPPR
jgi:hypothetical protein